MARIEDLALLEDLSGSDRFTMYSSANGDARGATVTLLLEFLQDQLDSGGLVAAGSSFDSQYSAPIAGATVQVASSSSDADGSENVHLILTPAGTLATLTIKLPLSTDCVDKQEVLVTCTQTVTTLSWNANGATDIVGEPTSFTAGGFVRLKFDSILTTWYRIG